MTGAHGSGACDLKSQSSRHRVLDAISRRARASLLPMPRSATIAATCPCLGVDLFDSQAYTDWPLTPTRRPKSAALRPSLFRSEISPLATNRTLPTSALTVGSRLSPARCSFNSLWSAATSRRNAAICRRCAALERCSGAMSCRVVREESRVISKRSCCARPTSDGLRDIRGAKNISR